MASQSSICKNKWHQISQPRYLPGLQALFTAQASAGHFQAGKLLLILVRNRNRKLGALLPPRLTRLPRDPPSKSRVRGREEVVLDLLSLSSSSFLFGGQRRKNVVGGGGVCMQRRKRKKERGFFYLFRSLGKSFRRLTSFAE